MVKARRRCSSDRRKPVIGRASACVMFQDVQFGFATLSPLVLQADGAIDLMHAAPIVIFERCGLKTGESYNDPRACWLFAEEAEMSLVDMTEIGERQSSDSCSTILLYISYSEPTFSMSNGNFNVGRRRRNADGKASKTKPSNA